MVRDPNTDCDRNENTGSIGDNNRDGCAAGRARDADSCADNGETRGGKDGCTGGGRHDGRGGEGGCARVHSGLCDCRDAFRDVCGDAAQRVDGMVQGWRTKGAIPSLLFFIFLVLWQALQGDSPAARYQSSTRCTSARTDPTITDIYPPANKRCDDQ